MHTQAFFCLLIYKDNEEDILGNMGDWIPCRGEEWRILTGGRITRFFGISYRRMTRVLKRGTGFHIQYGMTILGRQGDSSVTSYPQKDMRRAIWQ